MNVNIVCNRDPIFAKQPNVFLTRTKIAKLNYCYSNLTIITVIGTTHILSGV